MAREISDVTRQIAEHTNAQNQIIFHSIMQLGLVPLASISQRKCIVNFVLGSDITQRNVCVNYLNFTESSPSERALAIHEAIFEEYTGILGISTERAWPFAIQKNPSLTAQEIIYRLRSNIVFVLQPPPNYEHFQYLLTNLP